MWLTICVPQQQQITVKPVVLSVRVVGETHHASMTRVQQSCLSKRATVLLGQESTIYQPRRRRCRRRGCRNMRRLPFAVT